MFNQEVETTGIRIASHRIEKYNIVTNILLPGLAVVECSTILELNECDLALAGTAGSRSRGRQRRRDSQVTEQVVHNPPVPRWLPA